jgi:hypothetical protein
MDGVRKEGAEPARPSFDAGQWRAFLADRAERIRNPVDVEIHPAREKK